MGPSESPTGCCENQEPGRRDLPGRPRRRRCLLKGCDQHFHPRRVRQRYCSERCREAARRWSRWKAQQRYRGTSAGKEKRNSQSRRYRDRVRSRETHAPKADGEGTRVITQNFFSIAAAIGPAATKNSCERREVRCKGSARTSAGRRWNWSLSESGTGGNVAVNPDILIQDRSPPYIQLSHATGVSSAGPALGATAGSSCLPATAAAGVACRVRPADADCGGGSRRPRRPLCDHRRLQAGCCTGATGTGHGRGRGVADERG